MEQKPDIQAQKRASLDGDAAIVADKTRPVSERKAAHERIMQELMNPDKDFNPDTFEPSTDPDIEIKKRGRTLPPRTLPTLGLKPKKILEGQMVGMYESKQDLYLLIAHLYNRVADLEDRLNNQ